MLLESKSSNASFAHPILPHAFILGATPKDIAVESTFLYPAIFKSETSPQFLVCFSNIKPNFVITLFSSFNGTISEIVPRATISKYFKYCFSSNFNFWLIAWHNLKATPTPASSLNGYVLSFLLQSTTAIALGKICPGSWWSVTIVSMPNSFAYSTSSIPVIPQSTVIIKL